MSDPVATATRIRRGESIITDHRRKQHGFTVAGTRDMDGQSGESAMSRSARVTADHAAFFFATAFFLATMTSGNSTTRAGTSAVPF